MIMDYLLVAIGGCLGAVARYQVSNALTKNFKGTFPHATLFINLLGSYVLGFLVSFQISSTVNLLIGIGFLGAFTTFSTLKLELLNLLNEGNWVYFTNYFVLTYLFGIALAYAGFMSASLIHDLSSHFSFVHFMLK